MENALAPFTRSSYSTAWSSFTNFCEQNRISYTSYNLQLLLAFIAHLRLSLRLAPFSIRCYLAGIQYQFRLQSIPSPLLSSVPEIRLTLRGMEKSLPPSSPSRQPISTDLLLHLIIALRQGCFNPFDDIVMETLCLIAFFGFLRCSEFSTPSTSSFPALGLKRSDLSQIPGNHFILHIRSSKTDQLSQGQFVQFSKINSPLCPSSALSKYLACRIPCLPSDPLFIDSSRSIVTRHWFSSHLSTLLSRIGLSSNYFSPHSFRIGAATSAARAGINQHLIKSMGRWTSSAVELYIRSSSADIATAHQALVSLPRVGGALSARPTRGFLPVGGVFPLHSADGS
ncbi:UNVERIFIED_CONTAM: hypothetical protein FKN15_000825 [Acipenser sinensis]